MQELAPGRLTRSTHLRLAASVVALLCLTSCDTSNYAFRVDESIDIVQPKARTEVPLPVLVRWTDSRVPKTMRVALGDADAEYYAVFLDAAPMGPGKRLRSLLDEQNPCQPDQPCPNAAQLEALGIHLVARPSVTLEFVADLRPSSRKNSRDVHEVTIVRMRGDKRIGEAAFRQTFFVRR